MRTERDPLGEKARPRRGSLRHPDAPAAGEFSHLRPAAAAGLRGRGGLDQALRRADAQGNRAGWSRSWPMPSSRRPTRCSAGQHRDQFIVDVYQAGAGTSHNMNCNEVLANRANELLGRPARGIRAGASQRSRQHGAEHQRRDPDRDAPGDAGHAAATAAGARSPGGGLARDRARASTTSSSRAGPICRMPPPSGWARNSPPTAIPSSGIAPKLAQAARLAAAT